MIVANLEVVSGRPVGHRKARQKKGQSGSPGQQVRLSILGPLSHLHPLPRSTWSQCFYPTSGSRATPGEWGARILSTSGFPGALPKHVMRPEKALSGRQRYSQATKSLPERHEGDWGMG